MPTDSTSHKPLDYFYQTATNDLGFLHFTGKLHKLLNNLTAGTGKKWQIDTFPFRLISKYFLTQSHCLQIICNASIFYTRMSHAYLLFMVYLMTALNLG
jgi:hypothetical protein